MNKMKQEICTLDKIISQQLELSITMLPGDRIRLSYEVLPYPPKEHDEDDDDGKGDGDEHADGPCCPPYCDENYSLDKEMGIYQAEGDGNIRVIRLVEIPPENPEGKKPGRY